VLAAKNTTGTVDSTPPSTTVTSPGSGSTVGGTVVVTASAADNSSVSKVELYVDGKLLSTDTTSPYSYSWNSSNYTNGSHSLFTRAYDTAGNIGNSATIAVNVSNSALADTQSPVVNISSPTNGSVVSGTVTIKVAASDNVRVTRVDIYIDGTLKSTLTAAPYSMSWNTRKGSRGQHTITSKAYDPTGNMGLATVTVSK